MDGIECHLTFNIEVLNVGEGVKDIVSEISNSPLRITTWSCTFKSSINGIMLPGPIDHRYRHWLHCWFPQDFLKHIVIASSCTFAVNT